MNRATVLRYTVAALIVVMLGALAGWYVFIKNRVADTAATDAARGYGVAASFGSPAGGNYENISGGGSTLEQAPKGSAAPRLWKITTTPVAGFGFAASSSRLYFVERATGNILEANPENSSVARLTNTLFPKVYDAFVTSDGSAVLRTLSASGEVASFAGSIATSSASSTPGMLKGTLLPESIAAISAHPSANKLFFIVKGAGGATGYTSDWRGGAQKQVFVSSLSGWQTKALSDGSQYVLQNPSDGAIGYAFKIETAGPSQILPGLPGLTVLPRQNSSALIYGTSQSGSVALFSRASADSSAVQLPLRTLADKCAWAPGQALIAYCAVPVSGAQGAFVQNWYTGALHTTDVIWKVDASSGVVERYFTTDSATVLDIDRPVIDEKGGYLAFMNRYDGALWLLRLDP